MNPFEYYAGQYDTWYDTHREIYAKELEAVRRMLPPGENGIEIGAGTGRFAAPLGIRYGIEPSSAMGVIAQKRNVEIIRASAEHLPFIDGCFDLALFVTSLCFMDTPLLALKETHRILKPTGILVIGFIDRDTPLGTQYEIKKNDSLFYKKAQFHSAKEVFNLLDKAFFAMNDCVQTLFDPAESTLKQMGIRQGSGDGGFVVVRAERKG